MIGVLK
jgi:hypothetical protein